MKMSMKPKLRLACLLGLAALLLASCGGSSAGLIPASNAGPLQEDFEAVARAAHEGNGSCHATEQAIAKTESDFHTLPANVDKGLRKTLSVGIANLRDRALEACAKPAVQATATESTLSEPRSTHTTTSSSTTQTEQTASESSETETTSSSTTESSATEAREPETNLGGVEAPSAPPQAKGNEQGKEGEGK